MMGDVDGWRGFGDRGRARRLVVISQVCLGRVSRRQAGERLGLRVRQVRRLVRACRQRGDCGLVSLQRGRASNHRLAAGLGDRIEALLKGVYDDFGATLAAGKLAERDGIEVSRETVRALRVRPGLHKPRTRKAKRVHALRERRPRFGEQVRIDGSPHDWFEGGGRAARRPCSSATRRGG